MNRASLAAERVLARRCFSRLFTTQTSLGSPSQLTVVQLKQMLKENGLAVTGKKANLIERLEAHLEQKKTPGPYDHMTLEQLKEDCKSRKLTISGSESDLRIRLQIDDDTRENLVEMGSIKPEIRQST